MRLTKKLISLGLTISLWVVAGSAYAVTPSNTSLVNSAKLTYSGNATGITTSVTVKIELVPTAVSIAATFSSPQSSVNKAENQTYTTTYTLQTNANGPDTYTIASVYDPAQANGGVNDVTGAAAPTTTIASFTLGATAAVASAASGQAVISVPADGTSNAAVNGLAATDTVIIGGATYIIASVVDNATGNSTITLTSNLASILAVGGAIYEYKAFSVNISDVGAIGGATNRLDVKTTVTSNTSPNPVYLYNVDVNITAINIKKYVREITAPCTTTGCGAAVTTSYDTDGVNFFTYYDAGVEAAPGETLEYLLVITTSTATITTALVTDGLPTDFTSYVASSTRLNKIAVNDEVSAPIFPLDSAADQNGLLIDDNVSRASGSEGSGSVGTSKTVYITYRVLVDS